MDLGLATLPVLLLLFPGCHNGSNLQVLSGGLVLSSPDEPAALTRPDAGIVKIDFGQVLIGATKTLTLDYASVGSPVTLETVTALRADPEFSLPFVPGTVVQATASQITVTFAPTSAGDKSAVIQLTTDSTGADTVLFELSGVGVPNGLSVAPNPVDFGAVEINAEQSVTLTITNGGPLAESIVVAALQGPYASRFSLGSPSSTALAPGDSATLNVTFAPLVDGAQGASFEVSSMLVDQPVTVGLGGVGVDSWLYVTSPLEFGFVQLGGTVVKSAVIKNASSYSTLHLVSPAPALAQAAGTNAFSLADTPPAVAVAISPGQSVQIPIAFKPPSLDEFSGTLVFTTDDPLAKHPTVDLDGYGGGPHITCTPQVNFGPVPVGDSVSQDAVCLNSGTEIPNHPLLALQIAQAGLRTDNSAFAPRLMLPDGGLAGSGDAVALLTGQQARIRVDFHPPDSGIFQNRLTVASNDIDDLDAGSDLVAQGGRVDPVVSSSPRCS